MSYHLNLDAIRYEFGSKPIKIVVMIFKILCNNEWKIWLSCNQTASQLNFGINLIYFLHLCFHICSLDKLPIQKCSKKSPNNRVLYQISIAQIFHFFYTPDKTRWSVFACDSFRYNSSSIVQFRRTKMLCEIYTGLQFELNINLVLIVSSADTEQVCHISFVIFIPVVLAPWRQI